MVSNKYSKHVIFVYFFDMLYVLRQLLQHTESFHGEYIYKRLFMFLCVLKTVVLARFACGNKKALNADSLHMAS